MHYLDNIKVVLTFLVVLGHSSEAAGGIDDVFTPTLASGYSHSLYVCCLIISIPIFPVAMNLFFFISGLFVLGSYQRKGRLVFLQDKLRRYILPALFSWLLIMPFSVYLTALATDKPYRYMDFAGGLGPAWFLLCLSLFLVAYALVQNMATTEQQHDGRGIQQQQQDDGAHEPDISATTDAAALEMISRGTLNLDDDACPKTDTLPSATPTPADFSKTTNATAVALLGSGTLNLEEDASPEIYTPSSTTPAPTAFETRFSLWWESNFSLGPCLNLWILGLGCVGSLVVFSAGGYKGIQMLDRSPLLGDFFPYWVPYFFGGCYASSHRWIEAFRHKEEGSTDDRRNSVEQQEESNMNDSSVRRRSIDDHGLVRCAYWTTPLFVLCLLAVTLYLVMVLEKNPFESGDVALTDLMVIECFSALVGLGGIVVLLDFTSRHLDVVNSLLLCMMPAAYTVYLIQAPVIAAVTWLWIWVLRHGMNIDVTFEPGTSLS